MHAAHLEGWVEGVKEKGDIVGRGAYDTTGAPTSGPGPGTTMETPGRCIQHNGEVLQLDTLWYEPKGQKADAYNQLMIPPRHRMLRPL